MGKSQPQLPLNHLQQQQNRHGSSFFVRCSRGFSRTARLFSFKCAFILLLSASVSLSAIFSVVRIHHRQSGYDANDSIKHSGMYIDSFIRSIFFIWMFGIWISSFTVIRVLGGLFLGYEQMGYSKFYLMISELNSSWLLTMKTLIYGLCNSDQLSKWVTRDSDLSQVLVILN